MLYTSKTASTYPQGLDTSIYTPGGNLGQAYICGPNVSLPPPLTDTPLPCLGCSGPIGIGPSKGAGANKDKGTVGKAPQTAIAVGGTIYIDGLYEENITIPGSPAYYTIYYTSGGKMVGMRRVTGGWDGYAAKGSGRPPRPYLLAGGHAEPS